MGIPPQQAFEATAAGSGEPGAMGMAQMEAGLEAELVAGLRRG
jgi:hypothetical protein